MIQPTSTYRPHKGWDLSQWLAYLETIHPLAMDFKLARIHQVYKRLKLNPIAPYIITVAGTNGKGSTSTTLAHLFEAQGYKTGLFTSPHLRFYNERIQIGLTPASDQAIISAFNQIEAVRDEITLTYFEFATLASFYLFKKAAVEIAIIEVGLGGRLDATNIVDANMALITPISFDHTHILGNTLEAIASEKAGIIKKKALVITSEQSPPRPILKRCQEMGARLYRQGHEITTTRKQNGEFTLTIPYKDFLQDKPSDFSQPLKVEREHPTYSPTNKLSLTLPKPILLGAHQYQNSITAVSALLLSPFPIALEKINDGLESVKLPGRFEPFYRANSPTVYLDVTHNEAGANVLAHLLKETPREGKVFAIFAMLIDKDPHSLCQILHSEVDEWLLTGLEGTRGQDENQLLSRVIDVVAPHYSLYSTITQALTKALKSSNKNDIILVFGSFHLVSQGIDWLLHYGYHN